MTVSYIAFEIKRYISRKRQFFILLRFHLHDRLELREFFPKKLIQTAQVSWLVQKYCGKVEHRGYGATTLQATDRLMP